MSTNPFFDALDPVPDAHGIGHRESAPGGRSQNAPCSCSFTSSNGEVDVYNEEAFRYFLELERKRSGLSNRPFALLLLDLKHQPSTMPAIDMSLAQKLFSALSVCVRETDFVGWYRTGSIVGAVLTQHADTMSSNLQELVNCRIAQALSERLPSHVADLVRVRVYQLPSAVQNAS
jgi:hypothetical protein